MQNLSWIAGLAALLLVTINSPAQSSGVDGQWRGQGSAESGNCSAFLISVSVKNDKISGKIIDGESDYSVTGHVSSEGQFLGEVSYLWHTIAKLTGDVKTGRGVGSWRTLKGRKCEGKFEVKQIRDGVEPELANRPKSPATHPFELD